jgi:hypothetical protein
MPATRHGYNSSRSRMVFQSCLDGSCSDAEESLAVDHLPCENTHIIRRCLTLKRDSKGRPAISQGVNASRAESANSEIPEGM